MTIYFEGKSIVFLNETQSIVHTFDEAGLTVTQHPKKIFFFKNPLACPIKTSPKSDKKGAAVRHRYKLLELSELMQNWPVSESRSSFRGGLTVKDSFRFMEDLDFPSFPRISLRSSFGVLANGEIFSLLWEKDRNTRLDI